MENIFGIVFFLAVMAASYYSSQKAKEKQEQERQQRQKKVRPEDLPEATRRMLYGDKGNVPTAQPRQAAPRRAEQPTAPPFVQAQPARKQAPPPMHPQQPGSQRPAAPPPMRPTMSSPPPSRPQQDPRTVQQQAHRTMQQIWQQAQASQQKRTQQAHHPKPKKQAQQQQQPRSKTLSKVQNRQPYQPPKPGQAVAKTADNAKINLTELFGSMDNVRKGIIMHEILGPPKGLQRY